MNIEIMPDSDISDVDRNLLIDLLKNNNYTISFSHDAEAIYLIIGAKESKSKQKRLVETKVKEEAKALLQFLNERSQSEFKFVDSNLSLIEARLQEGYTKEELSKVIDYKCNHDTFYMENAKFKRPQTIFCKSKIPGFIEEVKRYERDIKHNNKESN